MTVRVGILGVAHVHTPSYVQQLMAHPNAAVVGLYDRDPALAAKAEAVWRIPAMELEDLLGQNLDAVVICSENVFHRPLVEAATGRVSAILCEKPIATTMEDARAIIAAAEQGNSRLMIAFPVRYAPSVRQLKELLESGTLGAAHTVRATNHGSMPGGWFTDAALAGGGAVMDHTVHVMDLLRWLWPGVEVEEVYAEVGHALLHPDLGIDDVGLLSFRLTNGVIGTLDTSWSRPPTYPIWGDVTLEMAGDKGIVSVDVFSQNVLYAPTEGKSRWADFGVNLDAALIADFIDMVKSGRQPSITGWDGLKAMEVALAAYESARTGEPQPLNP
ncbi:MAG: Gfo/Idh/MocA family oxidoreductase [Anaerolineae bacterium]